MVTREERVGKLIDASEWKNKETKEVGSSSTNSDVIFSMWQL